MKNAFIKIPVEVAYTAETDSECEQCFDEADRLGIPAEKHCSECFGEETHDKDYLVRNIYLPVNDIKEVIVINDKQIQLERYSEDKKILVELSEKEFDTKLREIAEVA